MRCFFHFALPTQRGVRIAVCGLEPKVLCKTQHTSNSYPTGELDYIIVETNCVLKITK